MLELREKISDESRRIIGVRTGPWGVNVIAVEVKDVPVPSALEDAMSRQAKSERQVAEKFGEAAATMQLGGLAEPTALSACLGQESAQRAGAAGPCSQANPAKRQPGGPRGRNAGDSERRVK